MRPRSRVDFLVVGHVTHDLVDGGWRCGGAALYASVTASRLGLRAAVVTRARSDADLRDIPDTIRVYRLASEDTTEFVNTYMGEERTQRVKAIARPLVADDIPGELAEARIVLLGPVMGELDPTVRRRFSGVVGVGAQGWLRASQDDRVVFKDWQADAALTSSLAVFASTEDAPRDQLVELVLHWRRLVPFVIVTAGPRGGTAYLESETVEIPVFRANQLDPTGAGDVFAAAFLARYAETSDPYEATEFAAAAAACSVEGIGIAAIPDHEMIAARRREGAIG